MNIIYIFVLMLFAVVASKSIPAKDDDTYKKSTVSEKKKPRKGYWSATGKYVPDDSGKYSHAIVPYNGGFGDKGVAYVHVDPVNILYVHKAHDIKEKKSKVKLATKIPESKSKLDSKNAALSVKAKLETVKSASIRNARPEIISQSKVNTKLETSTSESQVTKVTEKTTTAEPKVKLTEETTPSETTVKPTFEATTSGHIVPNTITVEEKVPEKHEIHKNSIAVDENNSASDAGEDGYRYGPRGALIFGEEPGPTTPSPLIRIIESTALPIAEDRHVLTPLPEVVDSHPYVFSTERWPQEIRYANSPSPYFQYYLDLDNGLMEFLARAPRYGDLINAVHQPLDLNGNQPSDG